MFRRLNAYTVSDEMRSCIDEIPRCYQDHISMCDDPWPGTEPVHMFWLLPCTFISTFPIRMPLFDGLPVSITDVEPLQMVYSIALHSCPWIANSSCLT